MIAGERAHRTSEGGVDLVVAPGLRASGDSAADDVAQQEGALPFSAPATVAVQAVGCAFLAYGVARAWRTGSLVPAAPAIAYSLQPLALAGTELRPRDLWRRTFLRLPLRSRDLAAAARAAAVGEPRARRALEDQRATYEELLAPGTERFFDPRREDCLMCGSSDLAPYIEVGDLRMSKPGRFSLERCGSCDHEAAASFLAPGGHLLVEVPNGHSPLARLWGGLWYHWVAPQHTHFIPQANLEAELDRLGLDVVERQGAEAHIVGVDFTASLLNVVTTLAPPVRWPWLPRPSLRARLRRRAAILAFAPLFPLAILADVAVAVVVRATKGRYANNSYGIVARLREPEGAELVA